MEISAGTVVKKVTLVGAFINIVLSLLKLVFGFIVNSQTMIADGIHSFSDLVSDAVVLIGVKFWAAPPDKDHPYGHGRIETISTVIIAVLLAIVALFIGHNAIENLETRAAPVVGAWSIIVMIFAIVSKEALYWYTVKAAQKIHSSALHANAWHHRSDALSSIPALLAIVIGYVKPDWFWADAVGAMVVAAMLLVVACKIASGAFAELIDSCPQDICDNIIKITKEIDGVGDAHALRARSSGSGLLVDLHVEVDPEMSVRQGHDISEQVEREIIQRFPKVTEVIVHIEPLGEG